uniref:Uncharacterized protein n=1 Tax=Triticum urartu TaxID=4572 RepID=A0A8R7QTX9_TRIUA
MKIGTVNYVCRNIALSWILNMQDKDGNTALHLAVRKGSLRMFCFLIRNRQVQLNLINEEGKTPRDIVDYSLPEGIYKDRENDVQILKVLKCLGAERGIFHQGFLNEYDIDRAR